MKTYQPHFCHHKCLISHYPILNFQNFIVKNWSPQYIYTGNDFYCAVVVLIWLTKTMTKIFISDIFFPWWRQDFGLLKLDNGFKKKYVASLLMRLDWAKLLLLDKQTFKMPLQCVQTEWQHFSAIARLWWVTGGCASKLTFHLNEQQWHSTR